MNFKIINVVLFCLFSLCFLNKANAGLIVGDIYLDSFDIQWEYVGSFDLASGPDVFVVNNITPYNGIEAAVLNFGALSGGNEYALSSNKVADYINIENFIVNHKAWYDAFGGVTTNIKEKSESIIANSGGVFYDEIGDISAFIWDRAVPGEYINHVFKSVNVPEPSTFTIFILALIGLTARSFKKL